MTSFIKNTTYYITIQSGVNVDLYTYFTTYRVPKNRDIIATLKRGSTVGSNSANLYAMTTSNLSGYGNVDLIIEGEIQGAPGAANGGKGGNALHISSGSTNLTVTIATGGAIRGGGGGGGRGGKGSDGHWVHYRASPKPSATKDIYPWVEHHLTTGGAIESFWRYSDYSRWFNAAMGTIGLGYYYNIPKNNQPVNSTTWAQGTAVYTVGTNKSGAKEAIRRAGFNHLYGGAGGNGGKGQGYNSSNRQNSGGSNPTAANPDLGRAFTGYAGKGASGRWGATWGNGGATGAAGGSGYKFVAKKSLTSSISRGHPHGNRVVHTKYAGIAGDTGGAAGVAIVNNAGATVINNGTING